MAAQKISALTALAAASIAQDDQLPIVDTSAVQTKNLTVAALAAAMNPLALPAQVAKRAITQTVDTNDLVVYTCPANRKALVGLVVTFNTTVSTITATLRIDPTGAGTSYRMGADTAVGAGVAGLLGTNHCFVLTAGQKLIVKATALGLNIFPVITEFDDTAKLKTARIDGLANGDNTLYTVPAGKTAVPFNGSISNNPAYISGGIGINNESGGSLNYNCYAVPSGQSVGAAYKLAAQLAVGNNTYNNTAFNYPTLAAGDFIVVNTSSGNAGQSADLAIFEI